MFKSSSPQDAIVLLDDCTPVTATAVGGVTWPKTGLTYFSLVGVGELTIFPSGTYNVVQNYEFSNDLTNWKSIPMQNDSSVPLAENTAVTGAGAATMSIPVKGWLYGRVTITTYTSGTYNCRVVGRAGSAVPATMPVAAIQDGTWTAQIGNTPNTTPILANPNTDYPSGATPITGASGNVANASAVATLSGTSGKTTYITGFEVTSGGATAASLVTVAITGTVTGTLSYTYAAPAGATAGATPLVVEFSTPVPASAANTSIVVTVPALGAGNTNATVVAHGYQL